MSGSLIGGIIGAGIGFFAGNPALGWTIGSALGGLIDPGTLPDQVGPRLSDLRPQSSEYGRPIPIIYGTIGVSGNVIWASDIVEVKTETEEGGKGGPSQTSISFTYYGNFAIALCEGERTVSRLWAGPDKRLVWDGVTAPPGCLIRVYTGAEDQLPDPLIESYKGVGNVPAYRGLCYVVFENFPLLDEGNRLPFILAEVTQVGNGGPVVPELEEFQYPVTGSTTTGTPNWTNDVTMVYNSVTDTFWSLAKFDEYATDTYSTEYLFQVIDRATGHVVAMIPRPNNGIIPRDRVAGPCPDTYWSVGLADLVCDPIGDRVYLVSNAYITAGSPGDYYATFLFEFVASTGAFVRVTRPSQAGTGAGSSATSLMLKYNKYTGDLWCIVGYASNIGFQPTMNFAKVNKATGEFSTTMSLTFLGQSPATHQRVSPAQVCFLPDGRILAIAEPGGVSGVMAPGNIARTIYDITSGSSVPLATIASPDAEDDEFFYDFLYVDSRNCLYLLTHTGGTRATYWRCDLDTNTLTKLIAQELPVSISGLYPSSGIDKHFLPAIKYDVYRDLLWFGHVGLVYESLIALNAIDATLAYDIAVKTALDVADPVDDGLYYYAYGSNYCLAIIPLADAIYIQPYGYDYAMEMYDSRAAVIRVIVGTPGVPTVLLSDVVDDLSVRAGLTLEQIDTTPLTDIVDGYAVAKQTAVRAAIEALRPVYYFDAVESSGVVRFVKRGGSIVAQIPDSDLAASSGGGAGADPLATVRQMDSELPNTLNVNYVLKATLYEPATKVARRLIGYSATESAIDLPMVLSDTKAKQVAEVNLHTAWSQRITYSFTIPKAYAYLEPTDVVGVKGHSMRILKLTTAPRGYISVEAVHDDANLYTPEVLVTETPQIEQTVYVPGPTVLLLM